MFVFPVDIVQRFSFHPIGQRGVDDMSFESNQVNGRLILRGRTFALYLAAISLREDYRRNRLHWRGVDEDIRTGRIRVCIRITDEGRVGIRCTEATPIASEAEAKCRPADEASWGKPGESTMNPEASKGHDTAVAEAAPAETASDETTSNEAPATEAAMLSETRSYQQAT